MDYDTAEAIERAAALVAENAKRDLDFQVGRLKDEIADLWSDIRDLRMKVLALKEDFHAANR